MKKKILSLDAETNGLWGQAFAIGAILYTEDGAEEARFVGRCPIEGAVDSWVQENVLPQMERIEEDCGSYRELLEKFFQWRAARKGDAIELVHMGVPVEARLYLDAHTMGIIGDWDGPYPLVDCSAIPEIGDSVDGYNRVHGLTVNPEEFAGGTHNPLYDSASAAVAYRHWLGWGGIPNQRGHGAPGVPWDQLTEKEREERSKSMMKGMLG